MITMKAYRIYYFAPCNLEVRDVFIATCKVEAIKQFIIENKGKYNVGWVEEVEK